MLAEVTNDDGSMARQSDLERFADDHGLTLISVADLIAYRRARESVVLHVAEARLPTPFGDFAAHVFAAQPDGTQHVALVLGDPRASEAALVRVHSECLTGDVFGSCRCDCGAQLRASLEAVGRAGDGIVLYLRGRGFPADREYRVAAAILDQLGVQRLRLLTNNPARCLALLADGLQVVERVPLLTPPTADNPSCLPTRRDRLGHLLELI